MTTVEVVQVIAAVATLRVMDNGGKRSLRTERLVFNSARGYPLCFESAWYSSKTLAREFPCCAALPATDQSFWAR